MGHHVPRGQNGQSQGHHVPPQGNHGQGHGPHHVVTIVNLNHISHKVITGRDTVIGGRVITAKVKGLVVVVTVVNLNLKRNPHKVITCHVKVIKTQLITGKVKCLVVVVTTINLNRNPHH